jgi:hypothetical protein
MKLDTSCSDCNEQSPVLSRHDFAKITAAVSIATAVQSSAAAPVRAQAKAATTTTLEAQVVHRCVSLTPAQIEAVCFVWNTADDDGRLRTHVSNDGNIDLSTPSVAGDFYSNDQRELIREFIVGEDGEWDVWRIEGPLSGRMSPTTHA